MPRCCQRSPAAFSLLLLSCALLALTGCGGKPGGGKKKSACAIDATNLSGIWVSVKVGPQGAAADKFSRAKFVTEDGKKKIVFTGGPVAPGSPVTKKYTYDFSKTTPEGTSVYVMNLLAHKGDARVARLKKDNRREELHFERRITASVDSRQCLLVLKDDYVTYIKGEEKLEPTGAGQKDFKEVQQQLGFVDCNEPQQLLAFKEETIDFEKSQPLDMKAGIFAKEPVWFHYIEKHFEGTEDEKKQKLAQVGVLPEGGCSYDYDFWVRDLVAPGAEKLPVTPGADGYLKWAHQYTFDTSSLDGVFVEMHRYKTCADGKRSLIGATCHVAFPEPERTPEEKAQDASGAGGNGGNGGKGGGSGGAAAPSGGKPG